MTNKPKYRFVVDQEGKPMVIPVNDWECKVVMERYEQGGMALRLIDATDHDPIYRATSNLLDQQPGEQEVFIKNYAENEGVLEALMDAGLVSDTGKVVETGHAALNIARMSDELATQWQAFRKELPDLPDQEEGYGRYAR